MEDFNFENAYYIKLGLHGVWEQSSIDESKLRIGWSLRSVKDFNAGKIK